jgi:hypothetical protein
MKKSPSWLKVTELNLMLSILGWSTSPDDCGVDYQNWNVEVEFLVFCDYVQLNYLVFNTALEVSECKKIKPSWLLKWFPLFFHKCGIMKVVRL